MRALPEEVRSAGPSTVRYRVSEEMVAAFAALTGDRSSLHVSEAFARRSSYRRPVVHGMLPVGFLALLGRFRIEGFRCIPVAINGHFSAPVYSGDCLILNAEAAENQEAKERVDFRYSIKNENSGIVVTRGTATVVYDRRGPPDGFPSSSTGAGLVPHPPEMRNARLEELERGQRDGFDFKITDEALRAFVSLLAEGTGEKGGPDLRTLREEFCLANLLSILLFSTSVGVSLPGASATFLEFSAEGDGEIELDRLYRLNGEVTHVSRATRIVKKSLIISRADRDEAVLFHGKTAALVNEPSRRMPTLRDLKTSAMDMGLKGKVVLITGASRGIGETTAKLFGLLGARVIVNYHRGAEDAARIVSEILAEGGDAVVGPADVTHPEEVRSLIRLGTEKYGTIHILVNNAVRDYRPIPFLKLTWEEIQKEIDVTVKGAFHCCREVIPLMLAQGSGKIVNISSVAVDNPPPDQAKYVMAKSALMGLTRSLSIELASKNIQVNMVVPNFVETDLVSHIPEGFRKKIAQETPMQRHASPVDVAQGVIFLASSYSSFTTGQKIMVTGGGAPYL